MSKQDDDLTCPDCHQTFDTGAELEDHLNPPDVGGYLDAAIAARETGRPPAGHDRPAQTLM